MITPEYAATMSRYNHWQNRSFIAAASSLTNEDRWKDQGAFFRSIAETLNNIFWDGRIWLARFRDDSQTVAEIAARHPYTETPVNWLDYVEQRRALDAEFVAWVDLLTQQDLSSIVTWQRGHERVQTKLDFNLVHLINHQAHHRGQVHSLLTQAGATTGSTDLQVLGIK